jgi:serine/threonine protein phosphatase 1
MSTKYFAISDVHSAYTPMVEALVEKGFNCSNPEHKLILCGDAFDRMDETVQVFEFIKELKSQDRLIYIRGNHEDLLFDCINELVRYGKCGGHHYSNGTIKTLSHFINEDDYWIYSTYIPTNIVESIVNNTKELRAFIQDTCVDYFTLGNKIFVHSWLPTQCDLDKGETVHEEWFNSNKLPALWKKARWNNGFVQYKAGLVPVDKVIVFGHWHTSWYRSHILMTHKEWPQKNRRDFYETFYPVITDKIVALDSCVAYTGKINCVVFDENGEIVD